MMSFPHFNSQQENLQQLNEDIFRLLLDCKDSAIMIIDASGYVMSWNAGAEHIYGFKAGEAIGKHISEFYTGDIRNELVWTALAKAKEKGRHELEGWRYKKDGTKFYVHTVITALYNEDSSLKGFAKITQDITIQKEQEEEIKHLTCQLEQKVKLRTTELEVANKELEAFSYSVSHDLRAPLRAISGYSNMLKEDYETKLDSEGNRIIDVVIDNAKMMSQLIDNLLSFSKMSRLEVVNEAIDMKMLAEKCVTEQSYVKQETKYTVTIQNMPKCKGDASMLKQVWHNLISNAIKYSSKNSDAHIEIGAIEDSNTNIYYVKDNGIGFDMKYSGKLFGVFQRLQRQDEYEGTGLGLALAKRIINKHGGKIWAEASLNKGATFYFSLPLKINNEQYNK